MWTCPKCSEAIEDQFDSCWKCAGPAEPSPPSKGWSRRAKICCGLGVAFELLLILLCAVLPRDSWLWVKCFNFLQYSHFPILAVLQRGGPESAVGGAILLLLIALGMGFVWGLLFY